MRVLVVLLLLSPGSGLAQTAWPYEQIVEACVADADPLSSAKGCIGNAANTCMENEDDGFTTAGMANCVLAERDIWDAMLNTGYVEARKAAERRDAAYQNSDPVYADSAASLLAAQRAWIAFRDTNCAMKRDAWGNGTMRVTASAGCHMQMTAERTLELLSYSDLTR